MTISNNYLALLKNLDLNSKLELIAHLSNSILVDRVNDTTEKERLFFSCFGALDTEESADEIIEIFRSARTFRDKDISL